MNPNIVAVKLAKSAVICAVVLSFWVPALPGTTQSQLASPAAQSLVFEVASIKPTKLMGNRREGGVPWDRLEIRA
jgi:hypothetical protein